MTPTLLYHISAFVLVLFAAGHTLGFLKFKAPTPEGVAVQQAMGSVRFSLGGKSYPYGDFYRGFGLFCTAYLLFAAFLAWHLGTMARSNPQAIGALGWVFFGLQLASIVLSWKYMLFGVRPNDAVTFIAVAAMTVLFALLACYLPARRAIRVDPLVALRSE